MTALRTLLSKSLYYGLGSHLRRGFISQVVADLKVRTLLEWQSPEQVANRQFEKLQKLISYAVKHVSYYRRLHAQGLFPDRLKSAEEMTALPVLTKKQIMEEPRAFIADSVHQNSLLPRWTGGSSGEPLKFWVSESAMVRSCASEIWGNSLAGYRLGDPVVVLWGSHFDAPIRMSLQDRILRFLTNSETLVTDRMTKESFNQFLLKLEKHRPTVLIGYVSSLTEFAMYLKTCGPSHLRYPTRGIITAAEPLTSQERELLESAFGVPVYNRYGTRECGLVAMECDRHEGMHIDSENVWVDIEPHEECMQGMFRILITKLNEFGMPFIRYDQGDYTTGGLSRCSCGRGYAILANVNGRQLSILRCPDRTAIPGEVLVSLLGVEPIRCYQVVQEADFSLEMRIVPDVGYDPATEARILMHMRRMVGNDLPIRIKICQEIKRTPSGKLLPVVSRVKMDS